MKKITFLLFAILSVSLFGQVKLTSSVSESLNNSVWENSSKREYIYDGNNNLIEEIEYGWNETTNLWIKGFSVTYTYNPSNKATVQLYQDFEPITNTISEQRRTTNTYNAQGNIIQILDETYNNNVWVNDYKTDITYSNNRIVSGLSYHWNGTNWYFASDDGSEFLFNYNVNGTINNTISNRWNGTNFVDYNRTLYSYDANNRLTLEDGQQWNGTNWVSDYRVQKTYDTNGNVINDNQVFLDNGVEAGNYTEVNTFDTNQLMSSFTHPFKDKTGVDYLFSGNGIVNKILTKSTYDNTYRTTYNYGESTASTNNFSLANFSVYPNPTNSILTIDDRNFSLKNVEVYDLLGKKVLTFSTNQFNLESLVNGVYVLKIQELKGNFATKRIVKN
jgi:hypothetical protein